MSSLDSTRIVSMNKELYEYKRKVIERILESEDIIRELNIEGEMDPGDITYTHIFPFGVIAPTQTEAGCYITVEVTMPQVSTANYFFKDVLLVINVICHNDLMRTDYSIPRHDYLSAKICELFNGSTFVGYGEMQLVSNTEGAFSERHSGRTMRFQVKEQTKNNLCV